MAASTSFMCCNLGSLQHAKSPSKISAFDPSSHLSIIPKQSSFLHYSNLQSSAARDNRPKRDLAVHATPEVVAADAASSFLPFLPSDMPWYAWAGCLAVAVPLAVQRLINLSNQVETVAETVEGIADKVGDVARQIDTAADDLMEKLPDGTLKNVVDKIEDIAEATADEAQKVEDLMDKVEEVSNKVEDFLVETTSSKKLNQ